MVGPVHVSHVISTSADRAWEKLELMYHLAWTSICRTLAVVIAILIELLFHQGYYEALCIISCVLVDLGVFTPQYHYPKMEMLIVWPHTPLPRANRESFVESHTQKEPVVLVGSCVSPTKSHRAGPSNTGQMFEHLQNKYRAWPSNTILGICRTSMLSLAPLQIRKTTVSNTSWRLSIHLGDMSF